MRAFIIFYLLMASSVLADGPPLFRDTTNKVTSRMSEWDFNSSTQDLDAGANKITGLAEPTADSDAATKSYADGVSGPNPTSQNLANASSTLTPSTKSKHITLFPPAAALSAGVQFNHSFNALDADFAVGTDTGTVGVGSPVVTGGVLDLTGGNTNFEAHTVEFNGDNMPHTFFDGGLIEYFHIRLLFRPNWNGAPSSNVSLLTKANGGLTNTASTMWIYIDTNGSLVWGGRSNLDAALTSNSSTMDVGWQKGELYQIDVNWAWQNGSVPNEANIFLNGMFWGTGLTQHSFSGSLGPIILGGENGTLINDEAPYFSNHTVEGLTVWSSTDGTDVRPNFLDTASPTTTFNFTPTYDIDGATSGTETIDTITGTLYEAGDTLTLINGQDGETFILTEATPLGPSKIDLTTRFTPKKQGDQITLEYTGSYWIEQSRHFVADGSNPIGSDVIVLTQSATNLATLGGSEVELYGSISALPADLVLLVDYSDNSFVPDFSESGRSMYFDQGDFVTTDETPAISGGVLQLNPVSAGYDRSAITYLADGGNATNKSNQGTVRLMVRPRYSGTPGDDIIFFQRHRVNYAGFCGLFSASGNAACRYHHRLINRTANGDIRLDIYNSGATYYALEPGPAWVPVANSDYELEYSWNYSTGNTRFFIDGTMSGPNATLAGNDYTWSIGGDSGGTITAFTLGGVQQNALDHTPERSNHGYQGFAVFNTEKHTANYTPTGLPGASAANETINTISADSYYSVGQVVRFYCREASRWTFTDTASAAADVMLLQGNWAPTAVGEWIDMRVLSTGSFRYWEEVARGP